MILLIQEKHIGLINNYALQVRQVERLPARRQLLQLTVCGHDNLRRLVFCHRVADVDARALAHFLVNGGNLVTEFADIDHTNNLNGLEVPINAQSRTNSEGASLSRTVLGLRNQ